MDAFTEALKERTRDRVPLSWAMTQNNLDHAIRILRERGKAVVGPRQRRRLQLVLDIRAGSGRGYRRRNGRRVARLKILWSDPNRSAYHPADRARRSRADFPHVTGETKHTRRPGPPSGLYAP